MPKNKINNSKGEQAVFTFLQNNVEVIFIVLGVISLAFTSFLEARYYSYKLAIILGKNPTELWRTGLFVASLFACASLASMIFANKKFQDSKRFNGWMQLGISVLLLAYDFYILNQVAMFSQAWALMDNDPGIFGDLSNPVLATWSHLAPYGKSIRATAFILYVIRSVALVAEISLVTGNSEIAVFKTEPSRQSNRSGNRQQYSSNQRRSKEKNPNNLNEDYFNRKFI